MEWKNQGVVKKAINFMCGFCHKWKPMKRLVQSNVGFSVNPDTKAMIVPICEDCDDGSKETVVL